MTYRKRPVGVGLLPPVPKPINTAAANISGNRENCGANVTSTMREMERLLFTPLNEGTSFLFHLFASFYKCSKLFARDDRRKRCRRSTRSLENTSYALSNHFLIDFLDETQLLGWIFTSVERAERKLRGKNSFLLPAESSGSLHNVP